MISKKNYKNSGFTLVETLVAISIFTVSLLGIMSILASSVSSTIYAKQKMTATYLAQEGIEYIRNMRDTDVLYDTNPTNPAQHGWDSFKVNLNRCNSNNGCSFDTASPGNVSVCNNGSNTCKLYINNDKGYDTNPAGTDSGFTRKIWMDTTGLGSDEVKIFSEVSWNQGSGPYNVTFSEDLFNWVE